MYILIPTGAIEIRTWRNISKKLMEAIKPSNIKAGWKNGYTKNRDTEESKSSKILVKVSHINNYTKCSWTVPSN